MPTKTSNGSSKDKLARYQDKRDAGSTNEPFGGLPRTQGETWLGRFVIHQHDATRMHYDLRLEIGGVLESFAVPKGPSLDPSEKHLAMHTEEHPLDYLAFEEVIPDGNYGAGPMILWDEGRVSYMESSGEAGLRDGKIDFVLAGYKVKGRFALIATGRRKKFERERSESEWLLVKKPDSFANPEARLTTTQTRSVESGLSIEELARKRELGSELEALARKLGAKPKREEKPFFRPPMIASILDVPLRDARFLYELKLDGGRILATKSGDKVTLHYRSGRDATSSFPEIARAIGRHPGNSFIVDGEVVHFDDVGRPSFSRLTTRFQARRPRDVERAAGEVPVALLCFDVLEYEGLDLRPLPLVKRKEFLPELVRGQGRVRALSHIDERGDLLMGFCEKQGLEGVVAKLRDSTYVHGPEKTIAWAKVKREEDDDFVVVGFTAGKNSRGALGALLLATYEDQKLVYRGRAGSGFGAKELAQTLALLRSHETGEMPLEERPESAEEITWVEPVLVARVRYHDFTPDGHLRAPVFDGFRPDRAPRDCRAKPSDRDRELETLSDTEKPGEIVASASAAEFSTRASLTNLDKIFWPTEGYSKRDLLSYYDKISEPLLRFLKGRPVVLVRYPDGVDGKNFYQWRAPEGTPSWIRTTELYDEEKQAARGEGKSVFLLDDRDALLHVINLGCIPLHVLASRETSAESCDFLTIDFDLGDRKLEDGVRLAHGLREVTDDLGLVGYPKTSGQRGLHVLFPLGSGVPFEAAKILTELLGRLIVGRFPELSTMERRKEKRGDKVYVDTGQVGRSRTIVSPYSVRAYAGARVSTPLRWNELHLALDPAIFNIDTVPVHVGTVGDPLEDFFERTIDLGAVLRTLARWTGG